MINKIVLLAFFFFFGSGSFGRCSSDTCGLVFSEGVSRGVEMRAVEKGFEVVVPPADEIPRRFGGWIINPLLDLAEIGEGFVLVLTGSQSSPGTDSTEVFECSCTSVCADVIAQHAGLNMAPASGGWVVGSREDIEQTTATIVGFAGEGHEARQEVWDMLASPEMRIILRSIVMYWGLGPEKTQIIRIALWQLEDGSGDWVVMVRHTGPSASRSRVLRLTELPGTRRFHCRWFSTADGFLASNFREDLDGDGVPDLLWVGLHSNPAQWRVANFVLSGATGKVLLEFGGESLLVADDEFGEPLVTVAEYRGSHFYRDRSQESEGPVVLKPCLRDREFGFEPLTADSLEKRSESGSVQGGTTLVIELAAVAPRFSNPRLYLLPGQDPGGQMPGVRGIESPGWKEFAITESRAAAGNVEGLCDAVHCLTFLSYVPEQAARP